MPWALEAEVVPQHLLYIVLSVAVELFWFKVTEKNSEIYKLFLPLSSLRHSQFSKSPMPAFMIEVNSYLVSAFSPSVIAVAGVNAFKGVLH